MIWIPHSENQTGQETNERSQQQEYRKDRSYQTFALWQIRVGVELLSRVVFARLNQAAIWSSSITSIPSLNLIPVTTFAR